MTVHDDLGTRMKEFYEQVPKMKLMRRTPVAIRCDGKAFHTFTRGFKRPFDEILIKTMQQTMKYLCENIQGCVFGYSQSDEITLILIDYQKLNSSAWFDYEIQKMCSIAASMATMAFNNFYQQNVNIIQIPASIEFLGEDKQKYFYDKYNIYHNKVNKAMFDARVFNIPKEEVTNLIYWRQLDATRNSIQMVGQANFSHKELQSKTCDMIQDMLMTQKGINWNDFPTYLKRGSACRRQPTLDETRSAPWEIDLEMPILKGENRHYVDDLVFVGE